MGDHYRSDRFEVGGEGRVVTIRRLMRRETAKTLMTKLPFFTTWATMSKYDRYTANASAFFHIRYL